MPKVIVWLQSAAGHEGVGDADGGCVSELHSYVEIIVLLKEGILKDVEHIPPMIVPILIRELCRDALKLLLKSLRWEGAE